MEDISDVQPSKIQPSTSPHSKESSNSIPKNKFKTDLIQNNIQSEERVNENSAEKEKSVAYNTKSQIEKPSNLET